MVCDCVIKYSKLKKAKVKLKILPANECQIDRVPSLTNQKHTFEKGVIDDSKSICATRYDTGGLKVDYQCSDDRFCHR